MPLATIGTRLQPNTLVQNGTGWTNNSPHPQKHDALGQNGTGRDEPSQAWVLVGESPWGFESLRPRQLQHMRAPDWLLSVK